MSISRMSVMWAGLALAQLSSTGALAVISGSATTRNIMLTASVYGYTQGQKVSGTNQSFTVLVSVTNDAGYAGQNAWTNYWLTDATVKIGGTTVESWTPGGGGGASVSAGGAESMISTGNPQALLKEFSVRWDSTNFSSNQTVTIECTADGQVSRSGEGPAPTGTATVDVGLTIYNVGFAGEITFARNHAPTAGGVADQLQAMNISAAAGSPDYFAGQNDSWQPILNSTVYYFNGDGGASPSCYGDSGSHPPSTDPPDAVWVIYDRTPPYDVYDQRLNAQVQGLPPMNFAFLDACLTGANALMETAFLYGSPTQDTAEMGWISTHPFIWHPPFTGEFWEELAGKKTVSSALVGAYKALLSFAEEQGWTTQPSADPGQELQIYGDTGTTLYGLYNNVANGTWYLAAVLM